MTKRRLLIVLAACPLMALAYLTLAAAQGPAGRRPSVVAVVGIDEVWKQVNATKELKAEIQDVRERMLREKEQREKRIKEARPDIEWLPEGSDEQQKRLDEVEEMAIGLQGWVKFQALKLGRMQKAGIEKMYIDTLVAIESVAEANGVDIIFYKERPFDFSDPKLTTTHVRALIGSRKVIYVRPELDLTDQVITRMNI